VTVAVLRAGDPVQIVLPHTPFHGMCGVLDHAETRRSGDTLRTVAWVLFGRGGAPVEFPADALTPVVARPYVPTRTTR
jgi:hypothetical protein